MKTTNPPVFVMKTGGFWSGLRDLNPRSLEPKSSAIPNFAKPGYSVEEFSDVVKHVVKSHFRPQILKSQERKVLEPQRFFGLWIFLGRSGRSAPKAGALPTALHPETRYIIHHLRGKCNLLFSVESDSPAGRVTEKNVDC